MVGVEQPPSRTRADTHSAEASRCLHGLRESAPDQGSSEPILLQRRPRAGRVTTGTRQHPGSPSNRSRWSGPSEAAPQRGAARRTPGRPSYPRAHSCAHGHAQATSRLASKQRALSPAVVKGNDRAEKFTAREEVESSSQETSSFKSKIERKNKKIKIKTRSSKAGQGEAAEVACLPAWREPRESVPGGAGRAARCPAGSAGRPSRCARWLYE